MKPVMTEKVLWRVVSFPPGKPKKVTPAKDQEEADYIANDLSGEHPLIEKKIVIESLWEIVR